LASATQYPDPEQLRGKSVIVQDWHAIRDDIACMIMDYAPSSLTDDEIIRAILASLGIQ